MLVLISPSYGSAETRRHWADTVERQVDFTTSRLDRLLTPEQRAGLLELHPESRARFWGATAAHDRRLADVTTGHVVLFTGQNRVRAIGEVGAVFRNREFADLLWPPGPGGQSWHTVYSLLDLVPADIPYAELNASLEYKPAHNFPGQMVLRGEKARAVLEDFMITPSAGPDAAPAPFRQLLDSRDRDAIRVAAAEEMRTHRADYQRTRRLIVVERREAELVWEYRQFINRQGQTANRFECPAGWSDLYVESAEGAEVIEAKSTSEHRHVRQALGQLLDYAPYSPRPADRLAGLFPDAPHPRDVELLHRYGIDCVYRTGPEVFLRVPAPDRRRALMSAVWREEPRIPAGP